MIFFFFFSSRRRHTRFSRDWSSDVCSSDLATGRVAAGVHATLTWLGLWTAPSDRDDLTKPRTPYGRATCVAFPAARAGRMKTAARATAARKTTANLLCMDYPL